MNENLLTSIRRVLLEDTLADHGWEAAIASMPSREVIQTGDCHFSCWRQYAEEQIGMDDEWATDWARDVPEVDGIEEGFVDQSGRFHTRQEALVEWRKQFGKKVWRPTVDGNRDYGDSEDLYGNLTNAYGT